MAKKTQVSLNTEEAKQFLTHIITNNRELQQDNKSITAVELEGDSGVGKTSVVLQLASELGMDVQKINLSQIEDLGD